MASSAAGDVWAAGIYHQHQGGPDHPFVLHWDGRSWAGAAVDAPGQGTGNFLYGLAVSGPGQVWTQARTAAICRGAGASGADATGRVAGAAIATLTTYGLAGPARWPYHELPGLQQRAGGGHRPAGRPVPFGTPVG